MSFNKWLLCPVVKYPLIVSTLLILFESTGLSQINWTPIGIQNGIRYEMNPTTYKSGEDSSIVYYQLKGINTEPGREVSYIIVDVIARCNSNLQALSKLESYDHQGRLVTSRDFDIALRDAWETPIASDIYGNAFELACNSR